MAQAVGNIFVNLVVGTGQTRNFTSAANTIGRDSDRMRTALGGTQRSVTSLRASMNQNFRSRLFSNILRDASQAKDEVAKLRLAMLSLTAITGTSLTAGFAASFILLKADEANRLNNQLRTVTDSEENLIAVRQRLYNVSQLTRSDMAATITLYARLSRAAEEFGQTQEQTVRITETVQKAFAIGGASQAEAQGAALQLSQGIASDRFSGDEYRSVAENAPVLLQQMAKYLDVSIGKLREMAHAGELTGKVVSEAILGASAAIDENFNKTVVTVGQGLTRLSNSFLLYIGDVDSSVGVTQKLASALSSLADNMDKIAPLAAGLAGAGVLIAGGRKVGAAGDKYLAKTKADRDEAAAVMSGNAVALKSAQANEARARATMEATRATLASTSATVAQQQADVAALRQTYALTEAQYAQALANVELNRGIVQATGKVGLYNKALQSQQQALRALLGTKQQLRTAEAALAANSTALVSQTTAASVAATAHNSALAAMSVRARIAAGSIALLGRTIALGRAAFSGLLSVLGGPIGLAFIAATVAIGYFGTRAEQSAERSRKLTDELHALGLISDQTAGYVEGVTASINDLAADELRNKIRLIGEEIDRLRKGQNPFEQLFSYDDQALGNLQQELKSIAMLSRGSTSEQAAASPLAKQLLSLIDDFNSGSVDVAAAMQRLDEIGKMPGTTAGLDGIISRLRSSFDLLGGNIQYADQLQQRLQMMTLAGVPDWATGAVKQLSDVQKFSEGYVAAQDAVAGIAAEQARVLGLSEDQVAVEKLMASLRKDAAEAGADEAKIDETQLKIEAEKLLVLEKAKDAREAAAKAQQDFNDKVTELSTEIDDATSKFEDMQAAATIKRLLADFATGNMKADTLKTRLGEINSVNLSDPMDKLITKIIAAIGPLASLLGIFNSFGGTSPLGGDLSGPARPGGALGRSRRETASKQAIGQTVLDAAVKNSGMSERDAWIRDKTNDLQDQAAKLGGVATNAGATAAKLWELDQAQKATAKSGKDSTEAATKYAEGMAELQRNVASASLDPFIKEVLSAAGGMGIATDELDAFVAAVSKDGLAAAPEKFRAIADAMREVKAINVMQDLNDEALAMVQSPWDRRVFETLRDSGIEADSVYGKLIAQQIKLNEAMKLGGELSKDVWGGIAKDLMDGVSWTDALNNAVGRLRDRLLDMAIDLAGQAFTGILGNILGGIFGGGGSLKLGFQAGVPSFDGGGHTGFGSRTGGVDGKGGFLSLLHPNETITDHTKGRTEALMSSIPAAGSMEVRNRIELQIKGGSHEVQQRSSRNDGGVNIETIVLGPVKKAFAEGGMDTLMEGLYGFKRKGA